MSPIGHYGEITLFQWKKYNQCKKCSTLKDTTKWGVVCIIIGKERRECKNLRTNHTHARPRNKS
uniref:Uncharacterized protein n=1 Tax=Anopheles arabiensis TaxID=7173 RepID=A0A182IHQ7_ANOAR